MSSHSRPGAAAGRPEDERRVSSLEWAQLYLVRRLYYFRRVRTVNVPALLNMLLPLTVSELLARMFPCKPMLWSDNVCFGSVNEYVGGP